MSGVDYSCNMKLRRIGWLALVLVVGVFLISVYLSRGGINDVHGEAYPYPADVPVQTGQRIHSQSTPEVDQKSGRAGSAQHRATMAEDGRHPGESVLLAGHARRPGKDESQREKCQLVEIAIVSAGYNSTRTATTLIKSLLFYRSSAIHLHLIVDAPAQQIWTTLFETWEIANLTASYYLTDGLKEYVSWIPNKHYSGIYGLMKLVLPQILPDHLHKVIVLDTDIIFASDVTELWELFRRFNTEQAIGLVENQSDWYLGGIWKNYKAWPATGRGYNTGVILMDLPKLRQIKWMAKWKAVTERELPIMQATALADQDIFNAVLKEHPELVYVLPCEWNAQLSDHSKSRELCVNSDSGFKIIHWNSPKKMQVKHRLGRYYKNDYLTFVAHDGNLLRRGVLGCTPTNVVIQEPEGLLEPFDEYCYDFERLAEMKFRTHLYFTEYDYEPTGSTDVTLVAQLSFDRLQMLESLCQHWNGPMSLALYVSDPEAQQFADFVYDSDILAARRNVGFHVVYKDGTVYPVNYLRNVALSQARTTFVFLSDIDFLPMFDLYARLTREIIPRHFVHEEAPDPGVPHAKALVIPAFETQRYRVTVPSNKSELAQMIQTGDIVSFRYDVWPKGHATTNYTRWMDSRDPYTVEWEPDYEPYIIVHRDVPTYDQRFGGFGWNKVSHLMLLAVKGYELIVLPDVFIVHMPHAPSIDIAKFRSKSKYRRCLTKLKQDFVRDLAKVYGMKATKYLIDDKR